MTQLSKQHKQILVSDLRVAFDERQQLETFICKMERNKLGASNKEFDSIQASIDTSRLKVEFVQNKIETIEQIIVNNQI
jgi:hypothetical protein